MVINIIVILLFTSCIGVRKNDKILKMGFDKATIDRIVIVSTRGSVKYTIIDDKSISRIKNIIVKGKNALEDSKLEPDFLFEFYDGKTQIAAFNYIAGISEKKTANLIDLEGGLYNINTIIEDEFVKRIMKTNDNKNVSAYYISILEKVLENSDIKNGSKVIVDMSKDYTVTKYILSIDQKRIIDSIKAKDTNIKLLGEEMEGDYTLNIRTDTYTDLQSKTTVAITDSEKKIKEYYLEGTFSDGKWSYYIRYK